MNCDRYRPLLALLVGNDLDPREAADVRQHLSSCACCQSHWKSLEASMKVLQVVSHRTVAPMSWNLWAELSKRVGGRPAVAREPAPGWLTLGAFTAACAAVLWLTVSTPVFDFELGDVQLADAGTGQFAAPRSTANPFSPQLQLINDIQPAIPFQFAPDGAVESSNPMEASSRMLGGPRSF